MITLKKILTKDKVLVHLNAQSYADALGKILEETSKSDSCDWEQLAHDLIAHELSTPAIRGNGVAIPHIRSELAENIDCWIATLDPPTDILETNGSRLAEQVSIIAMFAVPTKMSAEYLQVVGSLARALQHDSLCQQLVAANSAEQFLELLFDS